MSRDNEEKPKRSLRRGVGYANPPRASQFQPGQSGNPKGRPKGSKNKPRNPHDEVLREIIINEAYRRIEVKEGPKTVKVPMATAVVRATMVSAVKGGIHAQRLATELIRNAEAANRADHEYWVRVLRDYKDYWDAELERRRKAGITDLPDPIPHPDHIDFDFEEGTAVILGPKNQHERDELDKLIATKEENQKQLAAKIKEIRNAKTKAAKCKAIVELEEIAEITRLIQHYDPDPEDGL